VFGLLRADPRRSRKIVTTAFALVCTVALVWGPTQALATYSQTMVICTYPNYFGVLSPNVWAASQLPAGQTPCAIAIVATPYSELAFVAGDRPDLADFGYNGFCTGSAYATANNIFGVNPVLRARGVAAYGHDLWIADFDQGVAKFSVSDTFGGVTIVRAASALASCTAVAVDASGSVYVADGGGALPYSHRVSKFTSTGVYTGVHLGDTGTVPAAILQDPEGIAVAPNFNVYVSDAATGKVWVYRPTSSERTSYSAPTLFTSSLRRPLGVACGPDGSVYVVDSASKTVSKFDPSGVMLGQGNGSSGATTTVTLVALPFTDPCGIAVAPNGHIFVTDRSTALVAEYTFQTAPPKPDLGPTTAAYANVTVTKGHKLTFKFKATDDVSSSCTVVLKVYKGSAAKATISCGSLSTAWHTKSWTCKLARGKYTWKVFATDRAGHTQRNVAYKTLTVR
jgi:sugar lactone lactonase YvrE